MKKKLRIRKPPPLVICAGCGALYHVKLTENEDAGAVVCFCGYVLEENVSTGCLFEPVQSRGYAWN